MKQELKQTEIQEIPDGWQAVKVKDVARINELSIDKNYQHDIIEYIDISSIENRQILSIQKVSISEAPSRAKRIVRDNDILISTVRPNLKHFTFIKKAKANNVASTGFAVITPYKVNPQYLYYYLTTDQFTNFLSQIADTHTSTYPAFNPDVIENANLLLPSLDEQNKIANTLGTLDDKIALNHSMNSTLEAIGQALFRRWFVEFEFPNEEGKPYRSSGGEMVETELGEVPRGWETDNLIKIVRVIYGYPFNSRLFNEKEGFPIIRIRDLASDEATTFTTEEFDNKYVISRGDVIVGMDGEFNTHIWKGIDVLQNQRICKLKGLSDIYSNVFIYYSIKDQIKIIEQAKVGTTVIHLSKEDMDSIKIILPEERVLKKFNQIVIPLIDKQITNVQENLRLSKIRDALLPKLVSGEIRVNIPEKGVVK